MAEQNNLPEGTDTVVDDGTTGDVEREGSAGTTSSNSTGNSGSGQKSAFTAFKQAAIDSTADLRGQAGERARDYASQGKDRASDALENLAKMVSDAAATVEEKIGPEYAGYARQAADAVSGAAGSLRDKSVDELLEDAKGYVKSSPALAIGIAAALGFVISRVARSGLNDGGAKGTADDRS